MIKYILTLTGFLFPVAFVLFAQTNDLEDARIQLTKVDAFLKNDQCDSGYQFLLQLTEVIEANKLQPDTHFAKTYNQIGKCLASKGNFPASLAAYQKALDIYLQTKGEKSIKTAATYRNLCFCNIELRRLKMAASNCQMGLSILETINQVEHAEYAKLVGNMASVYENKGDYQKALDLYLKSTQLFKQIDKNHPALVTNYYNIGNTHLGMEHSDKALGFFKLAYHLDSIGGDPFYIADDLDNIGLVYQQKKDYQKAQATYDHAYALFVETVGAEAPYPLHTLGLKGDCYNLMGEERKAIPIFNNILEHYLRIYGKQHEEVGQSYSGLGQSYLQLKEEEQALIYFREAAKAYNYSEDKELVFDDISFPFNLLNVFQMQATANLELFKTTAQKKYLSAAENAIQRALNLVRHLRVSFKENNSKLEVSRAIEELFNLAVGIALKGFQHTNNRAYLKKAFSLMEQSKSQLQLECIRKTKAEQFTGVPDSLLKKEQRLGENIAYFELLLLTEQNNSLAIRDESKITHDALQLVELKKQRDEFINQLEQAYPAYYQLKYDDSICSLNTVQQDLLAAKETAMVEYFVRDSVLDIVLILPDTFHFVHIPIDTSFTQQILAFRNGITGYYLEEDSNKKDKHLFNRTKLMYAQAAFDLYQILIKPLVSFGLPEKLIIIPDQALGYLSFEALLSAKVTDATALKNYPFLIHQYQLSYSYSATLLQEMQQKKLPANRKNLIAFAPVFGETGSTSPFKSIAGQFAKLKCNIPEVQSIENLLGGRVLIGTQALESTFRNDASQFKILHLSTHGKANDSIGDYSFLVFNEIVDSIENEILFVRDLYNIPLNADMVVLSACETGIGQLQKGEGIISLAKGFSFAGVKSMITTLWSVNDCFTKELMETFYEKIKAGWTKDAALRHAQIALIQSETAPHPFYWAPFIPVGDMEAIPLASNFLQPLLGSIGFIGLLSIFYFFFKKSKKDLTFLKPKTLAKDSTSD